MFESLAHSIDRVSDGYLLILMMVQTGNYEQKTCLTFFFSLRRGSQLGKWKSECLYGLSFRDSHIYMKGIVCLNHLCNFTGKRLVAQCFLNQIIKLLLLLLIIILLLIN